MVESKFKSEKKNPENNIEKFRFERERLNKVIYKFGKKNIKKFFALDSIVYEKGVLSAKIKELLGLTASLVLRCDDCILYHIIRCYEEGISDAELEEAFSIALVVGGSITIPHLRRAVDEWYKLKKEKE